MNANAVEKAGELIIFVNTLLLLILLIFLRKWQRGHGSFSADKVALIISIFFSFATVTTTFPLLLYDIRSIVVDIILLIVIWTLGFWFFRIICECLYKRRNK
jgi:hypothetical protein